MKICANCFADPLLRAIVENPDTIDLTTGTCDICGKTDVVIYDTEQQTALVDLFEDAINNYKKVSAYPSILSRSSVMLLDDLNKYDIFSQQAVPRAKEIIEAIFSFSDATKDRLDFSLLTEPVIVPGLYDDAYLDDASITKRYKWENFVDSIKHENRFHSNVLNDAVLRKFLLSLEKTFSKNTIFSRARISPITGYSEDALGMPPPNKTKSGRISAEGIPCFYLADTAETAVRETRSNTYDYVTVANFKLTEDINVIDLRLLSRISLFGNVDSNDVIINYETLQKIKNEIEKPLRSTENPLEYIPIQYVCDLIKSEGYKGIIYSSTLNPNGFNLATFSQTDIFEFVDKQIFQITNLSIQYTKI